MLRRALRARPLVGPGCRWKLALASLGMWGASQLVIASTAPGIAAPPVAASARSSIAQQPASPGTQGGGTFGASYHDLSTEQRALIDGLFQRAGTILGVKLDPRQRYDSAPLSSRTT